MKRAQFTTIINAPREKVWQTLWDSETYKAWTSVFSEGSYADTDWEEGSKVLFLSANHDGMYSTIEKKIPGEFISFKHLGIVKNGEELPLDSETKKWSGALENYTLIENEGSTKLNVEMDLTEDFEKYFNEKFPRALDKVKEISER